MKTNLIAGAFAFTLVLPSCISFGDDDDHKPVSTTTVTQETTHPQPYTNPALIQTTETRTTRTR